MSGGRKKRQYSRDLGHRSELSKISVVDDLREFEDFKENILPMLRKDLKAKLAPEEIRKKYASYIEARMITTALIGSEKGALIAARDLRDRMEGRAIERKQIQHQLAELSEEELDAVIQSEKALLEDGEGD